MALIPYEPMRYLENVRRDLDQFFTGHPAGLANWFDRNFGIPRIDVYETENEVVAKCDLPGLEKKDDLNIDIDNNVLTISGSINRTGEIKENRMHRQERYVGQFQRSVTLPARVSSEDVKAVYRNGVLEVRMPRVNATAGKKIDVEFH
ncbi:Hsp20/alpha crystallin family protein [Desulfotomaculum copahuensis]|uniref:Heat-shock protein Hsp20 n=1 Tax=Desulfotomaculum copahuensis TaxID=1838280 RepID=A0A1B7LIR2_9FIRM|nr:Hsp20/alpha crystallin family protein [Desulfotomaculum copahuensis]OAT86352.1 heat-shock protein Hsp20 [Desulfotomaculum copahuensis]